MNTVTITHLEAVCNRINILTGSPLTSYTNENGQHRANIGNYHLDGAYGGYALHRMCNESGGIVDVLQCGHTTKRDLADRMHAFIRGYVACQEAAKFSAEVANA